MSPFEIRLDLLKMSKDLLEAEYYALKEIQRNEWEVQIENARRLGQDLPSYPNTAFPYPTDNDIIAKAAMFNGFVSNSN